MTKPMDPEILAIKRALKVIEPFDEVTRRRIIQYVVSYFGWPGMRKLYATEEVGAVLAEIEEAK